MPARLPWLLEQLTGMLPITGCWVMVLAEPSRRRFVATADPLTRRMEGLDAEVVQSPGLQAARTGNRVLVADLSDRYAVDRFRQFVPRAVVAGAAAVYSFPLWSADLRIGGLSMCSDVPVQLDPVELGQAGLLADLATALIVGVRHDRKAREWPL
jgi:hypothetical protein